jgi:cell division protein FtsN
LHILASLQVARRGCGPHPTRDAADKVWYRVRIGPCHKMDDVNHMRADLARQGIDVNVVRRD